MAAVDVYLINLDRCPERFERIKVLLTSPRVALHRVRAVDGDRLADRTRPSSPRPEALPSDRALSRYEIGLILSHRLAWRQFRRTDAARCVVLEDDIYFGEGFAEFVSSAALGDCDFDVLKLEALGSAKIVTSRQGREINGRRVVRLLSTHMGAAGYMLTRPAAERLLALSAGAPVGMDSILFDLGRMRASGLKPLRIAQVIPALVIQHDARRDAPPGPSPLTSVIGQRRGFKLPLPPLTTSRIVREATRPFEQLWLATRGRPVEFR